MKAVTTAADLRDVELLDTSDAAVRLNLSVARVVQLERAGALPAARTARGRRVFLGSDLDAFIRTRERAIA